MAAQIILILGSEQDEHVRHMLGHLRLHRADVELLDSRWFPQHLGLSFDPTSGVWTIDLPTGRCIESRDIRSVYWRSYEGIYPAMLPDEYQNFVAGNDSRSLFESFLIHAPTRWVNGWSAFQHHQTKPVQLARAAQLGVPIPATCLGNRQSEVLKFVASHPVSIFKPVQGGDHTRLLSSEHLTSENLASLQLAPVTIQEAIAGTNIRVFVAGEEVVACEVRTICADYREDPECRLLPHELPNEAIGLCRELASDFQLLWTGIDFRLTPSGEYIFLEANPSPMFIGFEAATGLPLTRMLTDLLVKDS